tara:strand:- start:315 stop:989 length:675 start_codon:yes stop_codon:yes gene_type:complete
MKAFLLTILFTLPFVAGAASFEFVAGEAAVGESVHVVLNVLPGEEAVYTAKAVVAFDEKTLQVSDIKVADGWMALSQPGYDLVENGQIIKTAGFPGGITQKTPFLTFTATKLTDGPSIVAIEGASFVLNKESVNVVNELDTLTLGALPLASASLPAAFTLSESTQPATEDLGEITTPINTAPSLPAAVISIEGTLPVVPLVITLLVLLAGAAMYFMIRAGRRRL